MLESVVAQVGFEPTASLVLSQGGLPIAYRAVMTDVPRAGLEPANTQFKPSRSAAWRKWTFQVIPDGLEPSLSGCKPEVVAAGPRDPSSGRNGPRK